MRHWTGMTKRKLGAAAAAALLGAMAASRAFAGGLPAGYAQLPFAKASGECLVRTGLVPAATDKAELTFELSTVSGNQSLWCSRNDTTNSFAAFMIASKVRIDRNTTQKETSAALAVATKYTLRADYAAGTGTVTDDGTGTTVASIADLGDDTAAYEPEAELCLFASYTTDVDTGLANYGSWTFHSFKLSSADGTIRCQLVPAWRASDGAVGLYDTVRETFLENSLGGSLTLGDGYTIDENGAVLVAVAVTAEGAGRVRVGDGEPASAATAHVKMDGTGPATLTAVPDEGCTFFGWALGDGATLASGDLKDATISVSAAKPASVKAMFYAPSDICAKLVGSAFHFYKDETCSPESELAPADAPASIAGCKVLFANDAEYQALVPFTNELATAQGGMAQMQGDITLDADADWRKMDFNMNGKTLALNGYDLMVHKPQGTGRITAGNLVENGDFESGTTGWTATGGYLNVSADGDGVGSKNRNKPFAGNHWGILHTSNSSSKGIKQTITVPKSRTCYIRFRYSCYSGSTFYQYEYLGIDSWNNVVKGIRTDNSTAGASTPVYSKDISAGNHEIRVARTSGFSVIDEITISPTSYLTFDIPEGEEFNNESIVLGSTQNYFFDGMGLKVRKTGKGSLVMSKVNSNFGGGNGITSMFVEEGTVKKGAGATCGAQYSRIEVMDGAQFDINGRTYHDYDYTIAGTGPDGTGALVSGAELDAAAAYAKNTGQAFLRHVALADDATIYAGGNMGMIFYNYGANTMTMNGHTVTYDGAGDARIFAGCMSYSGEGRIAIAENGWFQTHQTNVSAGGCDVVVAGRYWQNTGAMTNMNSFTFLKGAMFRELNAAPATSVVYSAYAPNETSESVEGFRRHPTVQLGDADHLATTLDLSQLTEPFDDSEEGTLSIYSPAAIQSMEDVHIVTVELGERDEGFQHGYLYKWKEAPQNVKFVRSESMARRRIAIEVRADGIAIQRGTTIIIR